MGKLNVLLVAALALGVIGLWLTRTPNDVSAMRGSVAYPSHGSVSTPTAMDPKGPPKVKPPADDVKPARTAAANTQPVFRSERTARPSVTGDRLIDKAPDWDVAHHTSGPFPISPSLQAECSSSAQQALGASSRCAVVYQALKQFETEKRDDPWARDKERSMSEYLNADPAMCTVRALECRSSVCVVECASTSAPFTGFTFEFVNREKLLWLESVETKELRPEGETIAVTLWIYTRDVS